jgi:hypothetical protein
MSADDTGDWGHRTILSVGVPWRWRVRRELNVLALIKGNERYVFVYDEQSRELLLEVFRAQAANPELSLNWFDAAVLTQKAHEQATAGETVFSERQPRF